MEEFKKIPYQKAESEIIDLNGADNFFMASGEQDSNSETHGSMDGLDNDT